MIFRIKMPYEVPNDVIMYHEKRIEWNILIFACMPYGMTEKKQARPFSSLVGFTVATKDHGSFTEIKARRH